MRTRYFYLTINQKLILPFWGSFLMAPLPLDFSFSSCVGHHDFDGSKCESPIASAFLKYMLEPSTHSRVNIHATKCFLKCHLPFLPRKSPVPPPPQLVMTMTSVRRVTALNSEHVQAAMFFCSGNFLLKDILQNKSSVSSVT